jgi:two-component system chemotaxis response regulator CheB
MKDKIRILVVDDSPLVRKILVQMLQSEPGFEVVGEARDGKEAVQMTATLRPDVVTMDINMPGVNGLDAIRQIMSTTPTPITVVSSNVSRTNRQIALSALSAGALTVVEKPKGLTAVDYAEVQAQLATAIRLVAGVQVVTLSSRPVEKRRMEEDAQALIKVVAVAASTGGPGVLHQIFSLLPHDLSFPIVVVQHITPGFGGGFAKWLNSVTEIEVRIARDGEPVVPGHVLIAPEGKHLTVSPGRIVRLDDSPPINSLRPSADRLFDSVARAYRSSAMGVVLTGMGSDGAEGLAAIWRAGGYTIAQDEASCVVFGMPRVAIERGVVHQVLSPEEIGALILHLDKRYRKAQVAAHR